MGDRVGVVQSELLPLNSDKRTSLIDFIVEFTYSNAAEVTGIANNTEAVKATKVREKENSVPTKGDDEQWTLYVDDTFNNTGSGADMMLISLEGHKIHCAIYFRFKALNNEVEYEALIAGLRLAHEL